MNVLELVWQRPALYARQEAALFGPSRFGACEASTKAGKTTAALCWLVEQALAGPGPGTDYLWVSPSHGQSNMVFRRLQRMLPRDVVESTNGTEATVKMVNGATIWHRSGDRPDMLYGHDNHAAVLDEASRMSEAAWHAVRSTLTATGGPARLIGNVSLRRDWFWALCRDVEAGKRDGWEYHRLTWEDAVEAGVVDEADINEARRSMPPSVFSALYEAVLSQDIEQLFPVDKVTEIDTAPDEMDNICRAWDLAASTHRASSYTSGALIGVDYTTNETVIADVVTGRWDAGGVLSALSATALHDGPEIPVVVEEEKGSSGKLLIEQIRRQLPEHKVLPGKLTGDKQTRAFGLAGRVGAGLVSVVDAEWTPGFLAEMASFPFGRHEDQVDAAVHGFNWLEEQRAKVYPQANFWKPTLPVRDGSIA